MYWLETTSCLAYFCGPAGTEHLTCAKKTHPACRKEAPTPHRPAFWRMIHTAPRPKREIIVSSVLNQSCILHRKSHAFQSMHAFSPVWSQEFQNPSPVWRQSVRDTQIQVLVLFSSSVTSSKHETLWPSGESFVTKMTPNPSISMPCFHPINLAITSAFPFIVPSPALQAAGSISFLDLSGAQWTSSHHCILTSQWFQLLLLIRTENSKRGTRPAADRLAELGWGVAEGTRGNWSIPGKTARASRPSRLPTAAV